MSRAREAPPRIDWSQLPLVMTGGAVGVLARHLLTMATPGNDIVMIVAINLVGSLLLGVVAGVFGSAPRARALLGTGLLGGFTSYSALAPMLGSTLALAPGSTAVPTSALAFGLVPGVVAVVLALAGISLGGALAKRRGQ